MHAEFILSLVRLDEALRARTHTYWRPTTLGQLEEEEGHAELLTKLQERTKHFVIILLRFLIITVLQRIPFSVGSYLGFGGELRRVRYL